MSILEVFDIDYLIFIFYMPVLLLMAPVAFRDGLRETPTRAACRWMIRELLFAHILITLAPQIFLTGLLFFAYFVGFKHAVLCMLLVVLLVIFATMLPFHKRYEKMQALPLPEDNPREHKRLSNLVRVTTAVTLGYAAVAWFIFLYCFVIPEFVWAMERGHHGTQLMLGLAAYFDTLFILTFPATCRMALEDFLHYSESEENFQWRKETFHERLGRVFSGRSEPEEAQATG